MPEYNMPELGYSRVAAPVCLHLERLGLIRRSGDKMETADHVIFEVTPLAAHVIREACDTMPPITRALRDQLELIAAGLMAGEPSPIELAAKIQDAGVAAATGRPLPRPAVN